MRTFQLVKSWVALRLIPIFGKRIVHLCDSNGRTRYFRGRILWGYSIKEESKFINLKPGGWIPIPRGYSIV